jgi:hypothetical protein
VKETERQINIQIELCMYTERDIKRGRKRLRNRKGESCERERCKCIERARKQMYKCKEIKDVML